MSLGTCLCLCIISTSTVLGCITYIQMEGNSTVPFSSQLCLYVLVIIPKHRLVLVDIIHKHKACTKRHN